MPKYLFTLEYDLLTFQKIIWDENGLLSFLFQLKVEMIREAIVLSHTKFW